MKFRKSLKGSIMLLIAAEIWGFAFVAQSVGVDAIGNYTFTAVRNMIGGTVLIPVILFFRKKGEKLLTKEAVAGGICCGIFLFVATSLQQAGIVRTSVGKSGFLTALYVVLVPVVGSLVNRKTEGKVWISVIIAVVGMYFLCMDGRIEFDLGELLLILCALGFTGHILVIDHFTVLADGKVIACIQFFTTALLASAASLLFEKTDPAAIPGAWQALLFAGIMSSGVAYTLQIVYQKDVEPAAASLIMSLESVFSVLGGWLLLNQRLSLREVLGCVLMFAAIVIAQV